VLTFASYRYLVHYASWLRVGFQHAHWRTVGDMTGAAFAFMAFPAGNAISIQGMLLVIGMTLGPAAVSAFSTMRTLTRVTTLMIDFAKGSIWGELSTAFGARDFALARRLHDGACQWTLWLSILSAGVMAMFGPWAYHMWTHGRTAFDLHVFYLLVLVSLADSLWIVSSITSVACNRHMPVSVTVIVSTLCAVGVAFVVAPHFGLAGAASSLFLIDVMMTYMVFRTSLRLLEHHVGAFVSRIARPPQLSSIVRQVRSIL
jgi:O-antigen/teichoic acid export membrane protein